MLNFGPLESVKSAKRMQIWVPVATWLINFEAY